MFREIALPLRECVEELHRIKNGVPPAWGEDEMLAAQRVVASCREMVELLMVTKSNLGKAVTDDELIEELNAAVKKAGVS